MSDTTIRNWIDQHLLRAWWTVGSHRRIESTSVDELAVLLRMPPGADRDRALHELQQRNRQWQARYG